MKPALISERMQHLDPNYRNFIQSGIPVEIARTFADAHDLTEDKGMILENGYALYLLFFFDMQTFSEFITTECGLDSHTAILLAHAMHHALPIKVQELHAETWGLISDTVALTEDKSTYSEMTKTEMAKEIAETEAALEKISPIRTMSGDNKQIGYASLYEPTYTSTQSAIINETK